MIATLEIRSAGAYASLQDLGRFGLRRIGVPCSGALDPRLLRIANRLAGQPETAAAIECFEGGQQFCAVDAPITVAVSGNGQWTLSHHGETRKVGSWRSFRLVPGECLSLRSSGQGRLAYVAVTGLMPDEILGSRSTYARARLGANQGAVLSAGDRLTVASEDSLPLRHLPPFEDDRLKPVRIVPGPQDDHFDPEALALLTSQDYLVGAAADRMGMRLEGSARLQHCVQKGVEIISDATVPGVIQVPGNGQPIVLLADGQTAGGYPKIATVISADLPRLAASRPGARIRFTQVDVATAESLARSAAAEFAELIGTIRPLCEDGFDLEALYSGNLVGGVVNALAPEPVC